MKAWTCILVGLACFTGGCSDESGDIHGPPRPTPSDVVLQNCVLVQAAAEAFANENNGEYPKYLTSTTSTGHTLIDFLPGSTPLTNPITLDPTEPVFMDPSGVGSTAYRGCLTYDDQRNARWTGYVVSGGLEAGEITISNLPDSILQRDAQVIFNCLATQGAVEIWARNGFGSYPTDNGDLDRHGHTVQQYLPETRYGLLDNPYTGIGSEPSWGRPAQTPGETGYVAIADGQDNIGYRITGVGSYDDVYIFDFQK